jgi:hypothetical protein
MKTVFQTDSQGIYVGPVTAWPDEHEEGRWLIPFGAVETHPPELSDHQAAQWTGTEWTVIADFRGFSYWLADRSQHTISEVAVKPPAAYLEADPGPSADEIAEADKKAVKEEARQLLAQSDITVLRCVEAGIDVPAAWKAWRAHLREVVASGSGPIDEAPSYPAGT